MIIKPFRRIAHLVGTGVACAVLTAAVAPATGNQHSALADLPSSDLFEKPTLLLAQQSEPAASDSSTTDTGTAQPDDAQDDADQFVFAGDLAKTLRRIDPDTKVDWDGTKLKIQIEGQEFAIFPSGEDMVINGDVESGLPPLTIRNGEIYVPQAVVGRIGTELEKQLAPPVATPEPPTEPTPATEEIPEEASTTGTSILPDITPATTSTTPTPAPASTGSILPDVTPAATAASSPTAVASPTAAPSVATPFPRATPTPTPRPTPTPTPTPTPAPRDERRDEVDRNRLLSAESFKAALQDKISISTRDVAVFNSTQLQEMAASRTVSKVVIHAEEGGLERTDEYGQESARLSLAIAQRVRQQLEDAGFEVEMTRNSSEPITAGEILQTITRSNAQVLLVISVGYSANFQDLGGYRVLYMNDSVDYRSLRDNIYDASEVVPSEMNYKPFQNMSRVLASSLRNSVMQALDRDPVGMNPAPLYFVRRAPMASVTLVTGYLSNPADAKRLTDSAQQDAMARAIVDGIRVYAQQLSQGRAQEGEL